jgi:hypothetical protein
LSGVEEALIIPALAIEGDESCKRGVEAENPVDAGPLWFLAQICLRRLMCCEMVRGAL